MFRFALFVVFLTLGTEIQLIHATEVSVNNTDNKLCLYANLMVNFSVIYEVPGNTTEIATFVLPDKVTTEGSLCDNTSSTLKLSFGDGHSWTVVFTKNDKAYQAESINVTYNLNDTAIFPNSLSKETMSVIAKPAITDVGVDTCYSCKSTDVLKSDGVTQTLWNVLIQAFVINGSKSENITSCAADLPTTTVAPTTHTTVTTTTPLPTTTPTPTPTPTPTLPTPTTGQYLVKSDENSTACLLANFGLRIGFKQAEKYQEINLDPSVTKVNGSCGVNVSELVLTSNAITIMFSFTIETNRFLMHALNVTAKPSSGVVFTEGSNNLTLWEAAVGSSYMCQKQQNYNITDSLTLYTFELRVQPFGVNKGVFSTAEECPTDSESYLVPIAVGVALVVLILIVLLAYFIGRKRNLASGYESF
ncbi:lysosome-associated membrane glycoprotein 2 isoform 3-T3 [Polymixia lowei]